MLKRLIFSITAILVILAINAYLITQPESLKVRYKLQQLFNIQDNSKYLIANKTSFLPRHLRYNSPSITEKPYFLSKNQHQEYLQELLEKYPSMPEPKMISVPGGTFLMGCLQKDRLCLSYSRVIHSVDVPAFELAQTEVTFELWDLCVAMGGCSVLPGDFDWGRGQRPVMNVSWEMITYDFLPWINAHTSGGYRLPSEAEWEYAARAGTTTRRYWGNEDPECDPASPFGASFGAPPWWKNSPKSCPDPGTPYEVASFQPNPWGFYDMLGNLHEWTNDCENKSDYQGAPTDGSAYRDSHCTRIFVRGGAWTSSKGAVTVDQRKAYDKSMMMERVGFRLARSINSRIQNPTP